MIRGLVAIFGDVGGPLEFDPWYNLPLDVYLGVGYPGNFAISTTPDGTHVGRRSMSSTMTPSWSKITDNNRIIIHADETVPQLYYYGHVIEAGHGGSITTPIVLEMTWQSTTDGNKYFVNGEQQPFIEFEPGKLYKFDVSGIDGHPLALSTAVDGTWGGGDKYAGEELSTDADGNILLLADDETPVLHYYCELHHGGMGWEATAPLHGGA